MLMRHSFLHSKTCLATPVYARDPPCHHRTPYSLLQGQQQSPVGLGIFFPEPRLGMSMPSPLHH